MGLLHYENALDKYYSSMKTNSLPLLSWDFYSQCFTNIKLSFTDTLLLNKIAQNNNWTTTWNFQNELNKDLVIVVTDAKLKILFASNNMSQMNGYEPKEVIGNSPKMFQGLLTDEETSNEIRMAIQEQKSFDKVILNYSKNGSLYKCHIQGYPIFNTEGVLTNFIAFEKAAA